ncbi:hypothetical protein I2I11_20320 [Pontibacter sp. 172403-2]|uniref:hypothetical protein n=1 Tax=Pontibacter rufus TaxID=2791028 RepID=UPI0018AF7865|nr:hypothetical protein [Pontibacter sp. 172403-2]MBF9255654.1 hypothetical protein [Pontibacter sp. 172403-2]
MKKADNWAVISPGFNLFSNNCIDFVRSVTKSIGIELPPRFSFRHGIALTPKQFLIRVKKQAYSRDGIKYKNYLSIKHNGNGTYSGPLDEGLPKGKGRLVGQTQVYKGNFKKGIPDGEGSLISKDEIFTGNFKTGIPNGQGELTDRKTGDKVIGNFINGKIEGKVLKVHESGNATSTYEIKDGKYVSPISTTYKNGSISSTQVDENGTTLSSIQIEPDGATISTTYKNGKPSTARIRTSDGREIDIERFDDADPVISYGTVKTKDYTYIGYLRSLIFHGQGVLMRGNDKWQGNFNNGRIEGPNSHVVIDGAVFNGTIWYDGNDLYQNGLVTYTNGDTYEGELKNNRWHGRGRLIHTEKRKKILGIGIGSSKSYKIEGVFVNGTPPRFEKDHSLPPLPEEHFPDNSWMKVPIPDIEGILSSKSNAKPNDTPVTVSKPSAEPKPADNKKLIEVPKESNQQKKPIKSKEKKKVQIYFQLG